MAHVWRRRDRQGTTRPDEVFGVGVQVHVIDDDREGTLGWVGDPTGVIVASATGLANGAFDVQRLSGRVWVVSFDEPQYRVDGAGPFDRASVPEYLLMTAPVADTSADDDEDANADRAGRAEDES
ncbi:hypothetical protein GCM10027568_11330 [Humibacter soli]